MKAQKRAHTVSGQLDIVDYVEESDEPCQSVRMHRLNLSSITKTCLFKYTENFTTKKRNFSDKKTLIFFLFLLKTKIVGTH